MEYEISPQQSRMELKLPFILSIPQKELLKYMANEELNK